MNTLPRTRFALLVAAALAASLLAGCSGDNSTASDQSPAGSATKKTPKNQPTDDATEPTGSPSGAGEQVTVPVYFVGDTPQGPRLYREFRKVDAANPLEAAAALLTSGDALDSDYRTLFPGGAFSAVHQTGTSIVAEVPDDGWKTAPAGMTQAEAKLAVQSLVYTLQGVAQSRARVLISLGESSNWVPLFGEFDSRGFKNAPQLEVSAFVNVTTPAEGANVSGSFRASGVSSSFEATVPWQIRQGDQVVKKGFTTAEGWMDKLYPFETEVDVSDLAPGTYTFVAMTDDPSEGEGGGPTEDSKTITIS